MVEFIGIVLVIATALFVGYPLWQKSARAANFKSNHQAEDWQARKEEIYAAIRDIDFDYRMGKLSQEDYNTLREQYKSEAISLMKKIDALTLGVRPAKGKKAASKFCHNCGEPAGAGDKFCTACGESLA